MQLTGNYTTAGAELAASVLAGTDTLTVTKAYAGSGITAASATSLDQQKQQLALGSLTAEGDTITIPATLISANSQEDYILREIGLYAQNSAGDEILYLVFTIDQTITVSPDCSMTAVFYLKDTVISSGNVTVTVSSTGVAMKSEVEEMLEQALNYDEANNKEISCTGANLQTTIDNLPKNLTGDVVITVQSGTASGNLVIKGFSGPGSLTVQSSTGVEVSGYVLVDKCTLRNVKLKKVNPSASSMYDCGCRLGYTSAFSVMSCRGMVTIQECTVARPETKTGIGFYISDSNALFIGMVAQNREICIYGDNMSQIAQRYYDDTMAVDCSYYMYLQSGSINTQTKNVDAAYNGCSVYKMTDACFSVGNSKTYYVGTSAEMLPPDD